MKIKREKRVKGINISNSGALSDLAFLLIIFFIVTAVFKVNQGFLLGLPSKDSVKIVNAEEIVKVKLTSENKIDYRGQLLSINELEKVISDKIKIKEKTTLLLKIDPKAKYQNVIDILNIVKKFEIENFSFSMIKE